MRMPRYFFHVKRGQMTVLDQIGIELGGQQEAQEQARRRLQEILTESDHKERPGTRGAVIVADEDWQTVMELPF